MVETEHNWKTVHKIGDIVASILLCFSLATIILLITIGGQSESGQAGFDMLAQNWRASLLRLDLLHILVGFIPRRAA